MAKVIMKYKVVVIGGSAGSLEVIMKIFSSAHLSPDIAYIIVVHRKNDNDSVLVDLLSKRSNFNIKEVEDKDALLPGWIYIAPADYHLLLEDQHSFSLDSSEKILYSRPSIDVTFESVAHAFGAAAIGILLSGANADGAKGLKKIKQSEGYTIVQNPATAEVDYMPKQGVEQSRPNAVLDAEEIIKCIEKLTSEK